VSDRALLASAAALRAQADALEAMAHAAPAVVEAPSSLVPLRKAGVSYRGLLAAAKAGEIQIHRRGKAAFVDRNELDAWIRAGGSTAKKREPDDIGELIDITHQRRRRRAG
jgi:hypothetical protein